MVRRSGTYEEAVDRALLGSVRPGDVVWDVGANVGHYSVKLADSVGHRGRVFAFEPSPANRERLGANATGHANITILPYGLSSQPGRVAFVQGDDQIGATSRLARPEDGASPSLHEIDLRRGDDLIKAGEVSPPDALKIDVEGHELEVLDGLAETLRDPRLRALVIEVHFGLLERSGKHDAPRLIEARLASAGFGLTWIDASHIHATRGASPKG